MLIWKPNWDQTKEHMVQWWNHKGLVVFLNSPADKPHENLTKPAEVNDVDKLWTDPKIRVDEAEYMLSRRYYGSDAIPLWDTNLGPGSVAIYLGAKPSFAKATVWYDPCIKEPDSYGSIKFDSDNYWFKLQMALIDEGVRRSRGRFLVSIPDLAENIDTLAALRGTQELAFDLIERPEWVHKRLQEINQAYFQIYDMIYDKIKDADGSVIYSAFSLWGPGKTAKVQADFSAMISAGMFREFVMPYLKAQCEWLDYSMYHLDGTNAMQHLDALLEIEALDAIEWTPQAGIEGGGDKRWYDMYRQIKKAGKSVQVVGIKPQEIVPLLDAVGPEGMFLFSWQEMPDQKAVDMALKDVERFR